MQTELGLRIISAIVMLAVVLSISWIGGLPFTILSILLSAVLFYEWQSIVRRTPFDGIEAALTLGFAALLLASLFGAALWALIAFAVLGFALEMTTSGDERSDVRWIGLGALYCAIPAVAFPIIRESGGFALLLFVFVIVWATDIGGYFVGRAVGGKKLLPAVSPKKTQSGALGGLAAAMACGLLFGLSVEAFSPLWCILGAAVLSIVSQSGDLFESWVKRLFNVKDSSALIPGHGGFLDRVDGLVAACVPVAFLLALGG